MLTDDKRRLAEIDKASDPADVVEKIGAFWADPERAERIPRPVLYIHIGALVGLCQHFIDGSESRRHAARERLVVAAAQQLHQQGASHDCGEWLDAHGVCAVCEARHEPPRQPD